MSLRTILTTSAAEHGWIVRKRGQGQWQFLRTYTARGRVCTQSIRVNYQVSRVSGDEVLRQAAYFADTGIRPVQLDVSSTAAVLGRLRSPRPQDS